MKNLKRFLALLLCCFLVASCYNFSFSTPYEANAIVGVDDAALIMAGANLAYAAGQLGIKLDQAHAVDHMINLRQKMTDVKFRVICGALMAGRMTYKQLYNLGADLFDYVDVSDGSKGDGALIDGAIFFTNYDYPAYIINGKRVNDFSKFPCSYLSSSGGPKGSYTKLIIFRNESGYINCCTLSKSGYAGCEFSYYTSYNSYHHFYFRNYQTITKGNLTYYYSTDGISSYDEEMFEFTFGFNPNKLQRHSITEILNISIEDQKKELNLQLTKWANNILKSTGHTKDGTELTDEQKRDWLQKSTGVYNPNGTDNIIVNNNYYNTYGGTNNAVNWIAGVKDLDTGLYVPALPVIGEDGSISVPSDAVPVVVDSDGNILNPDNPIVLPRDLFGVRDLTGNPDISIPGDIAIPGNPDIPMNPAIPDVTVPSVDLPTPDGSKPSIGLYKFFPFSLPWDTYRLAKALIVKPRAPSFTFDISSMGSVWKKMGSMSGGIKGLFTTSGHLVTFSLSAFDKLAQIFRTLMDFLFIIGLTVGAHSHIHGGD